MNAFTTSTDLVFCRDLFSLGDATSFRECACFFNALFGGSVRIPENIADSVVFASFVEEVCVAGSGKHSRAWTDYARMATFLIGYLLNKKGDVMELVRKLRTIQVAFARGSGIPPGEVILNLAKDLDPFQVDHPHDADVVSNVTMRKFKDDMMDMSDALKTQACDAIVSIFLIIHNRAIKTTCCGCKKVPGVLMKVCAGCKKVRYCSKTCQTAHWDHHKQQCLVSTSSSSSHV